MAKVKFSALISEMRNKLNGSVFARNRGGAYLRTKVTPVNPKSTAQVLSRARLTQFSQAWRSLTQAQREAWNSVVTQWSSTDVFGDVVNPSGNTLFSRLNINIAIAGGAELLTPPSPVGADAVLSAELAYDDVAETLTLTAEPADVPADHAMVVEATENLSPGITNANSKFRVIDTIDAATAGPFDVTAAYTAKFGAPVVGQKIYARAKFINKNTGEKSQAVSDFVIVE